MKKTVKTESCSETVVQGIDELMWPVSGSLTDIKVNRKDRRSRSELITRTEDCNVNVAVVTVLA